MVFLKRLTTNFKGSQLGWFITITLDMLDKFTRRSCSHSSMCLHASSSHVSFCSNALSFHCSQQPFV